MNVINMEPEVDPLGMKINDNTDLEEKKPLSEEVNLLNLCSTQIKLECEDHSCDLVSEIKFEEIPVMVTYPMVTCEAEEEWCSLITVKDEQNLEVTVEGNEDFSESVADIHGGDVSVSGDVAHEEQGPKNSGSSKKPLRIDTNVKPFTCDVCGKCFSFSRYLKRHVLTHTGEKPFKCNLCGKYFLEQKLLKRHASLCDGVAYEELDPKNSTSSENLLPTDTNGKPFICGVCGKCFSISRYLKRHVLTHTGKKPFKCNICGKCFLEQGHLKCHSRLHTGEKPFKCDVCGNCFSQSSTLTSHLRHHTGEKPFKCDICGKDFSRSSHLLSHNRQHTGEKPFKCEFCGKYFTHKTNLKSHVRLHTGERPFKCGFCGKGFSQSGALKIHERKHTTEKPFKCDVCQQCFSHKKSLRNHVVKHIS
ncbi:gastrula zinc finger protein XlCGF57.1-like isoform X2 [Periplaneta americana]